MKYFLATFFILCSVFALQGCNRKNFEVSSQPLAAEDELSPLEEPLINYAWHLVNTGQAVFSKKNGVAGQDLNLQTTWGKSIFGKDIKVLVSDDGIESSHEDLNGNYLFGNVSKNYTLPSPFTANVSEPSSTNDNHGTSVAGLIGAVGWNHRGSRGVAPKAKLVSANFLSDNVTATTAMLVDQVSGDFDVYNQSWGETQDNVNNTDSSYLAQLLYGVTNYRAGKGAIYVKAAGNSYILAVAKLSNKIELGNANFDSTNTTPYTVNVGALNASGKSTSYSTPGSNLWVSAPGGEDGADEPAMMTTDRTGCSSGYAASTSSSSLSFQKGTGNRNCKYTATFNGTSSAAPVTTGAVALLLEANPALTWRDVKYILAKSATKVDSAISAQTENPLYTASPTTYADHKVPTGYVYEQAWITNAAGFNFHNWYGFGRVNVDAAVALAQSYTSTLTTYTETNWSASHKRSSLSLAIPDNSATGVTDTITMSSNLKIEAVQLKLKVTHGDIGELAVELTSPSGTKSILININNALGGTSNFSNETLLTNAFYQEDAIGTWTIKVIDGRASTTGTLTEWSLNFIGGT